MFFSFPWHAASLRMENLPVVSEFQIFNSVQHCEAGRLVAIEAWSQTSFD
jgi:hypothetical protein